MITSGCQTVEAARYGSGFNITSGHPVKAYTEFYLSDSHIVVGAKRFEVKRSSHTRNSSFYDCGTFQVLHQRTSGIVTFYDNQGNERAVLLNIRRL